MDCQSTSTNTLVLYQTTIKCSITPSAAPSTFQVNEFGVWASLNSQAPFLFAYSSTGAANGDTVNPAAPVVKTYILPCVYSTLQSVTASITMTDVVGLHASTHLPSGTDPLPIAGNSIGGLTPKTPNDGTQVLIGGATASWGPLPLHGPTHVSTGRDPIPIATPSATGLLPVLSNSLNDVLHGTGTWAAAFFPGFITDFGGSYAPTGWLLCDGQAYSRTTYAALYTALGGTGSPWGQGDGYSSFNVPDLRGRATIGAGLGAGLTNRAVGARGGEETHVLSANEMAQHNHGVNDPGHAHSVYDPGHAHSVYDTGHGHYLAQSPHGHQTSDPGHAHSVYDPQHAHGVADPSHVHQTYYETMYGHPTANALSDQPHPIYNMTAAWTSSQASQTGIGIYAAATGVGIYANYTGLAVVPQNANLTLYNAATGIAIYGAGTGIAIYANATGISIQYSGANWAHNNMQPYAVATKIIKY
jgi:microcystin-dependent protein